MNLTNMLHLLALMYIVNADCEFYMVGNTKWIFPTTGEVRKMWLRTSFDNVNITFRFNFKSEKNLFDHEQWFRSPLKNTWYELELQQNGHGSNAVMMARNNQSSKTESWQLPNKRYENVAVDADEHVLLSICDPQYSGLNSVIGNCASSTFSTSDGIQSGKVKETVESSSGSILSVTTTIPSTSSHDLSTSSSPTSSVVFSGGFSPFLGLVIVLGLSIILNIILCYIAFRRRASSQQIIRDEQNQSIETIYENQIISTRHSAAFYNQNVQHRGVEKIYENPKHSTFPRVSTRQSTSSKQGNFKGSHQIYSIDNAGFMPSNDVV